MYVVGKVCSLGSVSKEMEEKGMPSILKNEYKDVRKSTNLTGIYCGLFSTQTMRRKRTQGEYIFMLKNTPRTGLFWDSSKDRGEIL